MSTTLLEARKRHLRFHAEIASKAAALKPRVQAGYTIPNGPFGTPKRRPTPPISDEQIAEIKRKSRELVILEAGYGQASETFSIKIDEIQIAAAQFFGLPRADLLAHRRNNLSVHARQVAIYLCKKLTLRSLPEIGRLFGGRDHTTILHAVRKIGALEMSDATVSEQIRAITNIIRGG